MRDENNLLKNKMINYWVDAWRKATSIRRGDSLSTKNLNKNITMWNNRANSFAQNTAKEKNKARQKEVFDFLDYCGVKLAGMDVLDLGCGPGNYTIPLAKMARHVWALDPASNMLNIVRDRAEKEGITNITYINKPWEEINLAREGWLGKFDLVFASMTPGVNDKETIEKMIKASKGYCFVSKFAGQRSNSLQEKLWQLVFRETWSDLSMDIIYPFNLVYSMGYFPSLKFITANWVNEETVEETIEKLKDWLSGYIEITPELFEIINKFVLGESVNGLVKEEVAANIGMMICRV